MWSCNACTERQQQSVAHALMQSAILLCEELCTLDEFYSWLSHRVTVHQHRPRVEPSQVPAAPAEFGRSLALVQQIHLTLHT